VSTSTSLAVDVDVDVHVDVLVSVLVLVLVLVSLPRGTETDSIETVYPSGSVMWRCCSFFLVPGMLEASGRR